MNILVVGNTRKVLTQWMQQNTAYGTVVDEKTNKVVVGEVRFWLFTLHQIREGQHAGLPISMVVEVTPLNMGEMQLIKSYIRTAANTVVKAC